MKKIICFFKGHIKIYMPDKDFYKLRFLVGNPNLERPWGCKGCGKHPGYAWWW